MNIIHHHITPQQCRPRTWLQSLLALVACMATASLFSSCVNDDYGSAEDASDTYLSLNVQTTTPYMSRAASDTTAANPDTEGNIYSIRVWAFKNNTGEDALPLSYKEESLGSSGAKTKTISMKIPRKSGGEDLTNLDLYILGNSESITGLFEEGKSMKLMTRKELADLTISQDFGITTSTEASTASTAQCTEVPSTGLPVSRVITGIQATQYETEAEAAKNAVQIPLIRAVSKLHFFFARKSKAGTDGVNITKIVMDGGVLPKESKVFPTSTTLANKDSEGLTGEFGTETKYDSSTMTMGSIATTDIHEIEDPTTLLRKEDEEAQAYMTRLRTATVEKDLSYLRESNKALTGKIYYKLSTDGSVKSVDFTIPTEEGVKAYRNHELTIYGYFTGGEKVTLNLKYYVADWIDKGSCDITFN